MLKLSSEVLIRPAKCVSVNLVETKIVLGNNETLRSIRAAGANLKWPAIEAAAEQWLVREVRHGGSTIWDHLEGSELTFTLHVVGLDGHPNNLVLQPSKGPVGRWVRAMTAA